MFEDKPPRTKRSRERERPLKRFHPVYLTLLIPYAAWIWVRSITGSSRPCSAFPFSIGGRSSASS